MNNFIDLQQFCEETLDIKLLNGEVVHIMKPTEKMYIDFVKFQNTGTGNKTNEEIMDILDKMVLSILNHNADGKKYKIATVKELLFPAKMAVMKAYAEFITKLTTQKNS